VLWHITDSDPELIQPIQLLQAINAHRNVTVRAWQGKYMQAQQTCDGNHGRRIGRGDDAVRRRRTRSG